MYLNKVANVQEKYSQSEKFASTENRNFLRSFDTGATNSFLWTYLDISGSIDQKKIKKYIVGR